MVNPTGNERMATLTGRARIAVALAAVVALSVFATDNATPASARATESTAITNPVIGNVTPAEIVTTVPAPKVKTTVLTRIKSGLASWYGEMFDGQQTASGLQYNENELTAAHKTLPFGSKVKVTDLRNKRSVIVTITDRGVLRPGRVIDLSLAAARQLRMVGRGVAPVQLELVSYPGFRFQN
jgi:rare lipoprotein A